jgi:hypothetical protein
VYVCGGGGEEKKKFKLSFILPFGQEEGEWGGPEVWIIGWLEIGFVVQLNGDVVANLGLLDNFGKTQFNFLLPTPKN